MESSHPDPRLLTLHEAFLQRLARSLVRDAHEAGDVVQEAYLAAIRQRPDPAGGLRGWLAGVVKNKARLRARTTVRRHRRETAAVRGDAAPPTADLVAREEQRRKVADAVLGLPEPYREVIVLRYLEDLPPRVIARRLGVPVETVRTRLGRARERLRERLDDSAGGGRGAGLALLAPWVVGGGVASGTGALAGAFLMSSKVKVVVLGIAALAIGLLVWAPLDADTPVRTTDAPREVAEADDPAPDDPPRLAGRPGEATPAGAASSPSPVAARPLGRITGWAEERGVGVAGASVVARPTPGRSAFESVEAGPAAEVATTATDPQGAFALEGLPAGTYAIEVLKDGYFPGRGVALCEPAAPVVVVTLERATEGLPHPDAGVLAARVVDAQGAPVAAARVSCTYRTGVPPQVQLSDEQGRVSFRDLPYERHDAGGGWTGAQHDLVYGFVTAEKDGLVGRVVFNLWRHIRSRDVAPITLTAPGRLSGRLRAVAPLALEGAHLRATGLMGKSGMWAPRGTPVVAVSHETSVEADGAYLFESLPPGIYYLTLLSPRGFVVDPRHPELGSEAGAVSKSGVAGHVRSVAPPGPAAPVAPRRHGLFPVKVEIVAGASLVRDLAVIEGATVRGRVSEAEGDRGVAGVRVEVEHAPSRAMGFRALTPGGAPAEMLGHLWTDDLRNPLSWQVLTTDSKGGYEVSGLTPQSTYFIRVVPHAGYSFDQRFVETGPAGGETQVDHRVEPAGAARLTVRSHATYALRHGDSEEDAYAFTPPWAGVGVVHLPGLRPGKWHLLSPGLGGGAPLVATFEVRAGEETTVDALRSGDCRVRGRVLRRGRPIERAHVWLPQVQASRVVTGEDGRFDLAFASSTLILGGLVLRIEAPEPGRPAVSVLLAERGAQRAGPDVAAFAWEGDVELPVGEMHVEVLDLGGAPLANAKVDLLGTRDNVVGEVGRTWWTGRGDERGRVVVEGLVQDEYVVTCTFPASELVVRQRVRVGEDAARVRFQAASPGAVRVRVLDDRGKPVAKVHVAGLFWDAGLDPGSEDPRRAVLGREVNARVPTDEDGETLLEGLPSGRLQVWASAGRAQAIDEIDVGAGEERLFELHLREP